MLLMPDPTSAILDPFYEAPTISLICTVLDPISREPYTRDPRYVATKAEAHLKASGIADTCYFGPRPSSTSSTTWPSTSRRTRRSTRSSPRRGTGPERARLPAPRRGPFLARLQEPLAGGLLPGAAQRHPAATCAPRWSGCWSRWDPDREPSPRGRRAWPGRDRPASCRCWRWPTPCSCTSTWSRTRRSRRATGGPSCRSRSSRSKRLGHARAPVPVEGRRDADASPEGGYGTCCRRSRWATRPACSSTPGRCWPSARRPRTPDRRLVPELRGSGAAQALAAQPLGRGAEPMYWPSPKAKRTQFRPPDPLADPLPWPSRRC